MNLPPPPPLPPPPAPDDNQVALPLALPAPPVLPWDVVVADPNWSFNDKATRLAPDSTRDDDQPSRRYETMPLADICALRPLPARDSVLFLWTTWAHLLDGSATAVARAWGYEPKVGVPWVKISVSEKETSADYARHPALDLLMQASLDPLPGREHRRPLKLRIGGGHYVRGCVEPLVIATRGSMTVPTEDRLPGLIVAERGGHSEKPVEVYDLIETMYPASRFPRRLEMFVRGLGAPGWSTWGHEASDPVPRIR